MDAPLVSCVIPARNAERYLAEALDSILAQGHRPLELIVVDDGSTDGTARVAARYGEAVHLVRQPPEGLAAARNAGVRRAQGEFVAHLDSDDVWHPEKLARQLARFRERPDIDLCLTRFQNFWVPELAEEARLYEGHPLAEPMSGYMLSTLLTRRRFFERAGGFDATAALGADSVWFVKALEQGAVLDVLPDILVRRRFHPANDSRTLGSQRFTPFARFIKARLDARRRQETHARRAP